MAYVRRNFRTKATGTGVQRYVTRILTGAFLCLLSLSFVSAAAIEAEAASRLCRQLEAQLAAAKSKGGSNRLRKYDRAVRKQRTQLQKALRRARRDGCNTGGIRLFNLGNSACRPILGTIDRMKRNLAKLERQRARLGRAPLANRAKILASIRANGCHSKKRKAHKKDRSRGKPTILDQLFDGTKRRTPAKNGSRRTITVLNRNAESGSGGYRTLCVRTCDGYYFPISFTASEDVFGRDEQICRSMCPGTEVRLFYHRVPDEESEDMVSLDGTPYTQLPTAFRYRQVGMKREKSCGCNPTRNFTVIAGETRDPQAEPQKQQFVPAPTTRPDPAADPETLANRQGGLTPDTMKRILAPDAGDTVADKDSKRKVRVVGPAFLPDPEGAIDLQAQAPKAVR